MISFIITAKNEPYLEKTIEDIRKNTVGDIEILAEEDDGRGQRAMLNKLAKKATRPHILKLDAHCTIGPRFDEIMVRELGYKEVLMPLLFPLDGEQWTINHHNPMSSYVFDTRLVMHFGDHDKKAERNESMCVQGSCFMMETKNWFDWNVCDESLGPWGHQGAEVGIAVWKNGGKCVTTHKTYYGHVFRHLDSEFPYERDHKQIDETHKAVQKLKTKEIVSLVEKFHFPCDWQHEDVIQLR